MSWEDWETPEKRKRREEHDRWLEHGPLSRNSRFWITPVRTVEELPAKPEQDNASCCVGGEPTRFFDWHDDERKWVERP